MIFFLFCCKVHYYTELLSLLKLSEGAQSMSFPNPSYSASHSLLLLTILIQMLASWIPLPVRKWIRSGSMSPQKWEMK
jgi:hypothetical protein